MKEYYITNMASLVIKYNLRVFGLSKATSGKQIGNVGAHRMES